VTKEENQIGVDVDSKLLVCSRSVGEKIYPIKKFTNDAVGHRKFVHWATQRDRSARVCMEATGVYSLLFALTLDTTQDIRVAVVNPRAIKHFAEAILQRGKTDAMDANTIREYLIRMKFREWVPPKTEILELQLLTRRVIQLNTELTRERNRHHAANRMGVHGRVIANDTAVNMRHIQRRIELLDVEILTLIKASPELDEKLKLLQSITGIADKTGPRILVELLALPKDMTAKQWVAYAGLDPRPYESGTSTHKVRRISKQGNKYVRNALYHPALVASRRDENVAAYYVHLQEKGKKKKQALVAIMRKLLLAIWSMFQTNESWQAEKFYKIA
jgi:transposase